MITRAQLRAPKGESRIAWNELEEFHEGLIALTGDEEGPLYSSITIGDRDKAKKKLRQITSAFGHRNVYVELQRHRVLGEERIVKGLMELADSHDLPVLATNGVLHSEPWGRQVLDVFTCLRHHTHLDLAGLHLSPNGERHLKKPNEMSDLFADIPEALLNTERLADRLDFTLSDLGYQFPDFPVPEGMTMESALIEQTYHCARNRYGTLTRKTRKQLEKELDLIIKLGFCGYFLIVADLVNYARSENILIQGRGSAANSVGMA
jgi:error-prone DNA polymerase